MENNDLKILQQEIFKITKEVTKLCDKHNIKYFLIAGSLLGAVRHKGFIPWDDDMDIGMMRDDYEKFLKIAEKELPKPYFLQTMQNEKNCGLIFAKVRNENTETYETPSKHLNLRNGIWLDIFPFDSIPDDNKKAKFHFNKIRFLNFSLKTKIGYKYDQNTLYLKIRYYIIRFFTSFISINSLKNKISKEMIKYNHTNCKRIINYGCVYSLEKEIQNKDIFNELILFNFENAKFFGPKNFNSYLMQMYGNYMKLPPKEKQKPHMTSFKINN